MFEIFALLVLAKLLGDKSKPTFQWPPPNPPGTPPGSPPVVIPGKGPKPQPATFKNPPRTYGPPPPPKNPPPTPPAAPPPATPPPAAPPPATPPPAPPPATSLPYTVIQQDYGPSFLAQRVSPRGAGSWREIMPLNPTLSIHQGQTPSGQPATYVTPWNVGQQIQVPLDWNV